MTGYQFARTYGVMLLSLPFIVGAFLPVVFAQDAAVPPEPTLPGIAGPTAIIDYFVYAALSAVSVGIGWAIKLGSAWAGLKVDDLMARRITLGLTNGLRAAYDRHQKDAKSEMKTATRDTVLAEGAAYAIEKFPDAAKHHKITAPMQLLDMAATILPTIEAEAKAVTK